MSPIFGRLVVRALPVLSGRVADLVTVRDPDDDDESPDPKTMVAVEVLETRNGATHFWSLEKLRFKFVELYTQFCTNVCSSKYLLYEVWHLPCHAMPCLQKFAKIKIA